jgi:acyl-[acyl-carrier-protein] desaturase
MGQDENHRISCRFEIKVDPEIKMAPPTAIHPSRSEVMQQLEGSVVEKLESLKPVRSQWQPSDLLPDLAAEDWLERVQELRAAAKELPDELLVVLVGDTITEEALPSYLAALNRQHGLLDRTGDAEAPWARWSRWWTGEENRHGEVLNKYLYLSGRVNMREMEISTQYLLRNGMNMMEGRDPYKTFVYTSFQERATKISHTNCGRLAQAAGTSTLRKICSSIAMDEGQHESAYKFFMKKIFELDPAEALLAFRDIMKLKISMPARLMDGEGERALFDPYSVTAERIGVYTALDYAKILEHLVGHWGVADLPGVTGEAAAAQDYLCELAPRLLRMAERYQPIKRARPKVKFSWIFERVA